MHLLLYTALIGIIGLMRVQYYAQSLFASLLIALAFQKFPNATYESFLILVY